jgi:uncharacterized protein YggE
MQKRLAAAVLMLATITSRASQLPDYPFVHATGEAFVHVLPDLGEIDFDLAAYDPDTAAAAALVQTRIAEIQTLLAEQGVDAQSSPVADAVVRDMRKEMRKSDNPDPKAAPEYEIRCMVHINVRDLSKWRAVMQGLLAKPNIDHMSTSFGLRERERVERELVAAAVKDAQRRGEAMAAGFGKKTGAVTAVSSGQLRNLSSSIGLAPSDTYRAERGKGVSEEKNFLTIDVLKWSQTVDMIFRIK